MSTTRKAGLANNPLERRQPRTGAHQDEAYSRTRRKDLLTGVTRKPGLVNNPLERRKPRLPNLIEQCVDVGQGAAAEPQSAPVALREEKKTTRRIAADKRQESVSITRAKAENGKNAVAAIGHIAGAPDSWTNLVDEALTHYLAVLERRYNNGEPFPPRGAALARGPRIT
ncbi:MULTISPECIES: hypothetical protein [unclassified Rhodococcus (in: high G+C Gram-positive bacteria)]|uniref:hypothetical protein n=1 Tax=unclassified Rhodococcus (in: high G+C Gram-positive bacteria) TaxID=192944 RepID=UPI00163ADC79|nr:MULTISPECIES: hypothetical protein [unclassified Rhodococcus (in: high G+C Gram-positive bacteria)]MBC2643107.1 hypothetical protein [Rhodococcus sp. 3A]MBC2892152.1 hypothetical protein [Rhodococcus sp. 4CII]